MLEYEIPNYKNLKINNLVFDFNGTLACSGKVITGVKERLNILAKRCNIVVLTADTFGTVQDMTVNIEIEIEVIKSSNGRLYKKEFIEKLGPQNIIAIGNGGNDELMLKSAALGILIIGDEGAAVSSLMSSDLIVKDIRDALDLLIYPKRLIATLRR